MNDIAGSIERGEKVKYTLLTENVLEKQQDVESKVLNFFDGATFYHGKGIYQGTREVNLTIVVIATKGDENLFMAMAEEIRALLSQEEVWVLAEPVELTILSIPSTARKDRIGKEAMPRTAHDGLPGEKWYTDKSGSFE